jgi:hypothetical protein
MILNKATKLLNDPYRSKVLQGGLFQAILAAKKHYKKRCPKRCPKLLERDRPAELWSGRDHLTIL